MPTVRETPPKGEAGKRETYPTTHAPEKSTPEEGGWSFSPDSLHFSKSGKSEAA